MPETPQPDPMLLVDELNIPDPGPPPVDETGFSWARIFQIFRGPNLNAKLEKSKDRARWAWINFALHDKMLRQAQVTTPQLEDVRRKMMVEHRAFMDIYEAAITENSKEQRKAQAKRLKIAAVKLQFRSSHFSRTTIDEISAQAGGRSHFPRATD